MEKQEEKRTFFGCKVMYICSIYSNNDIAGFHLNNTSEY